jgi:hypothetical protein
VAVVGKGSKVAVIPLPPREARAIDAAARERTREDSAERGIRHE